MRILVVEDQSELRGAIARRLRAQGHAVDEAGSVAEAEHHLGVVEHALVILDRMLPDGDAAQRIGAWRRKGLGLPILLLTAMDRVEDRVEGLQAGADDYLVKPFAMEELLARVEVMARRRDAHTSHVLRVGDLELDRGRREVRRGAVLIPLRPKEYALLEVLVSNSGQVVTRAQMADACWDSALDPSSNVEEALVASLRRKLGSPRLIHTVRGSGYLLEERPLGNT